MKIIKIVLLISVFNVISLNACPTQLAKELLESGKISNYDIFN